MSGTNFASVGDTVKIMPTKDVIISLPERIKTEINISREGLPFIRFLAL